MFSINKDILINMGIISHVTMVITIIITDITSHTRPKK